MAAAWGSSLTGTEQTAIDIAVQVSGQDTVRDLQLRLEGVRREIEFQKLAYQGGAQTLQEFQKEMQALIPLEAKLEEAFKRGSNALAGWNKEVRVSQQAGLQLAYALDDIQYGFNGIVNNIPGIVQSLGGSAGLAGGLGAAAVGVNLLLSALKAAGVDLGGPFKDALREAARGLDLIGDPIRDATDSLEGMKEKIQAIQDRPFKLDADYDALRTYTIEVRAAERATREFEALRNKRSESQQEAFKSVQEGIAEGGGAEALQKAILEIAKQNGTYGAGSEIQGKLAQQQAVVDYYADPANAGIANVGGLGAIRTKQANAEMAKLREELRAEQEQKARELMNLSGGEASRKTLQGLIDDPRNQGILRRNQIDVDRLGGGIGAASPENIGQRARNKVAKQEQERAEREQREIIRKEKEADREQEQIERAENRDAEATAREEAKMRRDTEAVARKNETAKQKAEREAAANARAQEREAPGIAKHAREAGYAQDFQAITGANNGQANYAGKQINAMVEKGTNPQVAAQQVYDQMMKVILKQQVSIDQLTGINSGALQQLQALEARASIGQARVRNLGNQVGRGRQRGPTIGMTLQ
jgi:hypothetical protein